MSDLATYALHYMRMKLHKARVTSDNHWDVSLKCDDCEVIWTCPQSMPFNHFFFSSLPNCPSHEKIHPLIGEE